MSDNEVLLLSGTANRILAEQVADCLSLPLGNAKIRTFKDGEFNIEIPEEIHNKKIFIIQSTNTPVNDNLMQLLLLISACKTYGARSIIALIPYFGYARQDRRMPITSPISAVLVTNLLKAAGVDTVVTVDIHAIHILSLFEPSVLTLNISTQGYISREVLSLGIESPVIVSPDAGGVGRARIFKDALNAHGLPCKDMAIIIKQRLGFNQVGEMALVGNVKDSDVIIVDDIIDTAGTLVVAADLLKSQGAKRILCFATHGIFSPPAVERINISVIDCVYVCDTIANTPQSDKIKKIHLAPLISQTIQRLIANN